MLVFLPEQLVNERLIDPKNSTRHPWGCILKPHSSHLQDTNPDTSLSVVLLCVLLDSCDSRPFSDVTEILHECNWTPTVDIDKLSRTIHCLLPDCPNHRCTSSQVDNRIVLSTMQSSLRIAFRWDILFKLRRNLFAQLLDQCTVHSSQANPTEEFGFRCSQLVRWEQDMLTDRLGPHLTALILQFTEFPIDLQRLNKFEQLMESPIESKLTCSAWLSTNLDRITRRLIHSSYTISLIRFHLQSNGSTHRLRGLLPGSLIPGSELLEVSRSALTDLVGLAYLGSYLRNRTHSIPDRSKPPPTPRQHSTDPTMSLLGAMQVLFLLLSLLTPLHHASLQQLPPDPSGPDSVPSCPHTTGMPPPHPSWMISETDCLHVPTLGWFFVNASDSNGLVVANDHPPHIMSPRELVNKWLVLQTECWFSTWNRWIEFFTCELTRLLVWLESGEPAGLKINLHLARLLGHFFLYHILAWRSYCSLLIHISGLAIGLLQQFTQVHTFDAVFCANVATSACLMLSTLYVARTTTRDNWACAGGPPIGAVFINYLSAVIRLTIALFICLLLDLINMITVHLTTFYVYTIHLLILQCRAIGAAWRLCRNGSKWNPLRNRVDTVPDMYVGAKIFTATTGRTRANPSQFSQHSTEQIQAQVTVTDSGEHDVHLDRLFVATLLGLAVGLCLLPTTLSFYVTFSLIHLLIILVQRMLRTCALFVLDVPLSALLAWMLHTDLSRTELVMTAPPMAPTAFPLTRIKLTRPSLAQTYEEHRLLRNHDLFGSSLSLGTLVRRLLTATEI